MTSFAEQFDRTLERLDHEIRSYPTDDALWKVAPGISNSGGTLALHLAGNLDHWIGACLGHNGYRRDRDEEFSARGLSRQDLIQRVTRTRATVDEVLGALDPDTLGAVFPDLPARYAGSTTAWFLSHLTIHLGYHLGQINYHRRLLAGESNA